MSKSVADQSSQPPVLQSKDVVIKSETSEGAQKSVGGPLAVKCLKDFKTGINGLFMQFSKGQIIGEYQKVQHLLATKAPVVPVSADEYSLCDNCGHIQKRG